MLSSSRGRGLGAESKVSGVCWRLSSQAVVSRGPWALERVGTCAPGSRGAKVRGSVRAGWVAGACGLWAAESLRRSVRETECVSFVSWWTCETLTQALPTPAARAPESQELPGAPCRGRRIIPGHVDSRGILKREMPSWPDQMAPQKLEGGWGTKGDRAGGRVSWPRVSERLRMRHSCWAPVWAGESEGTLGMGGFEVRRWGTHSLLTAGWPWVWPPDL